MDILAGAQDLALMSPPTDELSPQLLDNQIIAVTYPALALLCRATQVSSPWNISGKEA